MNIDWEFVLLICKVVFPLVVYIFLVYSFNKSIYLKIRWSIIGIVSLTYIVFAAINDYIIGFLLSVANILVISLICWGLSKLKNLWGKIIKGIFITIAGLLILFASCMSAFLGDTDLGGGESIKKISEIENDKYEVRVTYYPGNGAMPPGSRTIVTYIDNSDILKMKSEIFRIWYSKNITCDFISEDSLLIKLYRNDNISNNSNMYDSLFFDLSQDLDLIDYRDYKTNKYRSKNPEKLTEKIINQLENSKYKVILKRFQAEQWQSMGEWKILYIDKAVDENQEKILWRVRREDYADFDFLNETTLQIRTYRRQELDSLHIKKHYRDTVEVNLLYPDSTDFPY